MVKKTQKHNQAPVLQLKFFFQYLVPVEWCTHLNHEWPLESTNAKECKFKREASQVQKPKQAEGYSYRHEIWSVAIWWIKEVCCNVEGMVKYRIPMVI